MEIIDEFASDGRVLAPIKRHRKRHAAPCNVSSLVSELQKVLLYPTACCTWVSWLQLTLLRRWALQGRMQTTPDGGSQIRPGPATPEGWPPISAMSVCYYFMLHNIETENFRSKAIESHRDMAQGSCRAQSSWDCEAYKRCMVGIRRTTCAKTLSYTD